MDIFFLQRDASTRFVVDERRSVFAFLVRVGVSDRRSVRSFVAHPFVEITSLQRILDCMGDP